MIDELYEKNQDWKNWLTEESLLDLLLNGKNDRFRIVLRDFYVVPFSLVQENVEGRYSTDVSRDYFRVGGVVEFTKWKPCGLIEKLLQNFKITEYFQTKIHSMLMFFSICDWFAERNEITTIRLVLNDNSILRKLPGEFFLCFVKDQKMENVQNINTFKSSSPIIDFKLFREHCTKYETCSIDTIFEKTKNPPYGMKPNAATVVESLKSELYEFDSYSIDWSATIAVSTQDWCSYWSSGREWWGCYAMTSFNSKECAFIVATASCSD
ncbi:predicted protein [Naegleria gruberi]|uniref:Predicted protein n=1 Tax=Naegleria gruberi TaxID=5762 RepID=D2VP52_NAEGR|nr:uncharacterized protein NAEGRDRAFT_70734 [Naegleria gruberi]EFC41298.1 predicted protein [Naegleria gruberi]|eukprot:XP_002674042.1 predicted protein [Naegleria gruberi strain NEG-M]